MDNNNLNNDSDQKLSEELSFFRIKEVLRNPSLVTGNFDSEHLKNLHAYIFQDSPEHKPGVVRKDEKDMWFKEREMESYTDSSGNLIKEPAHVVPYLHKGLNKELDKTLDKVNLKKIAKLSQNDVSQELSNIYSKLDYIHPFHEGNSRTLRTFTHLMAKELGYELDWNTTNVTHQSRNELYNSRDLEVLNHYYKGGLDDKFVKTAPLSQFEYTTAFRCLNWKKRTEPNSTKLSHIIRDSLSKINSESALEFSKQLKTSTPEPTTQIKNSIKKPEL